MHTFIQHCPTSIDDNQRIIAFYRTVKRISSRLFDIDKRKENTQIQWLTFFDSFSSNASRQKSCFGFKYLVMT